MRTHYENLKVAENAPEEVIKAAYRALCQKHHPDKNNGSAESQRIMQIINSAYNVLSDQKQRLSYDAELAAKRSSENRFNAGYQKQERNTREERQNRPQGSTTDPVENQPERQKNTTNKPPDASGNQKSWSKTFRFVSFSLFGILGAFTLILFILEIVRIRKDTSFQAPPMVDPRQAEQTEDDLGTTTFTNSLGMKFVPVPGTDVHFCIHETRSRDYATFMAERNRGDIMGGDGAEDWRTYEFKEVPVGRGAGESAERSNHPVAKVSWLDAVAFCHWLSIKEGKTYRLPTDREWSVAVGIPQERIGTPEALNSKISDVYPWGGSFVAASIQGNYADAAFRAKDIAVDFIEGYHDGYATTAPVMSFPANEFGVYDMGGNLYEWCAGCSDGTDPTGKDRSLTLERVVRGGSWFTSDSSYLLSSARRSGHPTARRGNGGFRVVLVERSGD